MKPLGVLTCEIYLCFGTKTCVWLIERAEIWRFAGQNQAFKLGGTAKKKVTERQRHSQEQPLGSYLGGTAVAGIKGYQWCMTYRIMSAIKDRCMSIYGAKLSANLTARKKTRQNS
jgi:hypothetical protein